MSLVNPWQQGVEGVSVFLVRKSKHGATKDFSWSQVKPFDASLAATVKTNTTSRVKNDTNTDFILTQRVILMIHSCFDFGWMKR